MTKTVLRIPIPYIEVIYETRTDGVYEMTFEVIENYTGKKLISEIKHSFKKED